MDQRPANVFPGSVPALVGACLISGIAWACFEKAPTASSPPGEAQPSASSRALNQSGSAAGSPSIAMSDSERGPLRYATTRSHMLTHYAETAGMRRALVAGRLDEFRAAAAGVADEEWTPRLRADQRAYVDAVRSTARSAQAASSIALAAAELGRLGEACASCHVELSGVGSPAAPEQPSAAADATMSEHTVAADRMWDGLILPSDMSWSSGMQVLMEAPGLHGGVADVAGSVRALRALAREGLKAEVSQRGQVFADALVACAACHERVGMTSAHPPTH